MHVFQRRPFQRLSGLSLCSGSSATLTLLTSPSPITQFPHPSRFVQILFRTRLRCNAQPSAFEPLALAARHRGRLIRAKTSRRAIPTPRLVRAQLLSPDRNCCGVPPIAQLWHALVTY